MLFVTGNYRDYRGPKAHCAFNQQCLVSYFTVKQHQKLTKSTWKCRDIRDPTSPKRVKSSRNVRKTTSASEMIGEHRINNTTNARFWLCVIFNRWSSSCSIQYMEWMKLLLTVMNDVKVNVYALKLNVDKQCVLKRANIIIIVISRS